MSTTTKPVIICIADSDKPYWAYCAELGATANYATLAGLIQRIDFVFGKDNWRETDRRLADSVSDIPAALR